MEQNHLPEDLIKRYVNGIASDEERAVVESWHLSDIRNSSVVPDPLQIERVNTRMRRTVLGYAGQSINRRRSWPRIAAAASILLAVTVGGYFFFHRQTPPKQTTLAVQHDIAPGNNKAILTLADGSKLPLNETHKGMLAKQSGATIAQTGNGQLIYSSVNNPAPSARGGRVADFNTLSTPAGGQYQLVLPDGSHVWLNAASSITYPVAFTGSERKVNITGEAYFEVAKNKAKPFKVQLPDATEVSVLGTHFNINSYADEPLSATTLLEGSVRISARGKSKLLTPGQQATYKNGQLIVSTANIEEVIAWKNGYFRFHGERIESIMRKLSRWYDIEVHYQGGVTEEGFNGKISRFKNISQVLKMLEKTKAVHFKVEGRRITVMG